MKLMIEQFDDKGLLKTWQLDGAKPRMTIGSSPYVDIHIASERIPSFLGVFEYDGVNWSFIDLRKKTVANNQNPYHTVSSDQRIEHEDFKFSVKTFQPEIDLFRNDRVESESQGASVQVFIVQREGARLEVGTRAAGKAFQSKYLPENLIVMPQVSHKWIETIHGDISVRQKTFSVNSKDFNEILRIQKSMDRDDKKHITAFGLGMAFLICLVAGSLALNKQAVQTALNPEFQKIREIQIPEKKPAEKKAAAAPAAPAAAGAEAPPSRSAFNPSRISQLIGKISNARVRSKNFLVGKGVEAGSAPSGHALAALQKMNGNDLNFGDGKGDHRVSTAGIAGGKSVDGMGKISGGKAGSLGVDALDEGSEVVGGLDRDVIAQYIRAQIGQILYCYERQLSATPDLFGKIAVKFTINAQGKVETPKIGESTLRNANVEGCVVQKIAGWKFPLPEGGTQVLVTYPFFFKSTN